MEIFFTLNTIISLLIFGFIILTIYLGIKIVPQSTEYVVERFGKYTKTLSAGLHFIVPFLDRVAHRVDILERQLPHRSNSVITKDKNHYVECCCVVVASITPTMKLQTYCHFES